LTAHSTVKHLRLAYMMSRFPKITETFVLHEMIEMERLGHSVEVFPLQQEKAKVVQSDARQYVERAHFTPAFSFAIMWACILMLLKRPLRFATTLGIALYANLGSLRYFTGAIVFFPKSIYLAGQMQKAGIEHLHAHFASHPAFVAFVINRFSEIPYSFVAHGSDLHRDQHMLADKTESAAFVVAISRYNKKMIVDVCGEHCEEKVHVIHCGIDPSRFAPKGAAPDVGIQTGPLRILCVGTLHEVKGQTYLLEACEILRSQSIDFRCTFLGDGPDRSSLESRVEQLDLETQISFLGSVTSDCVREHLLQTDVLVAPSVPSHDGRREGIPVVLMEAMACGVPCISSELSGIPELVEDGESGFLTQPGDSEHIASALRRFYEEPMLRSQMAQVGLRKIASEFCLEANVEMLASRILETRNR